MGSLFDISRFSRLAPYAEMFGQGLAITIMLSLGTVIVGAILGVLLALMRMSDVRPFRALGLDKDGHLRGEGFLTTLSKFNPLSFLATAYVEVLRSTPVIVQIAVGMGIYCLAAGIYIAFSHRELMHSFLRKFIPKKR